jgi:hypothetical protein
MIKVITNKMRIFFMISRLNRSFFLLRQRNSVLIKLLWLGPPTTIFLSHPLKLLVMSTRDGQKLCRLIFVLAGADEKLFYELKTQYKSILSIFKIGFYRLFDYFLTYWVGKSTFFGLFAIIPISDCFGIASS